MAVTFVGGTTLVDTGAGAANSFSVTSPAGLSTDSVLLVFIYEVNGYSVITPSGWTRILGPTGAIDVYQKNIVTSADSSTAFTFSTGAATAWWVYTCCATSPGTVAEVSGYVQPSAVTLTVPPPAIPADYLGELFLMAAASQYSDSAQSVPSGSTDWPGVGASQRMLASYLARDTAAYSSGSFVFGGSPSSNRALSSVTIRVAPLSPTSGGATGSTPVTWIATGTQAVTSTVSSITATAPAGVADDDALFAAVWTLIRSDTTIAPPAGWTLVLGQNSGTGGFYDPRLEVYKKNTVTSADASASFTFTLGSPSNGDRRFAAVVFATSPATVTESSGAGSMSANYVVPVPVLQADASGELFIVLAFGEDTYTPAAPFGATQFATDGGYFKIIGAYQARDGDQVNRSPYDSDTTNVQVFNSNVGGITMRLTGPAVPIEALISAAGPLGIVDVLGWNNFTLSSLFVESPIRYVMDLDTPTGAVRVPISSWQATLKTDGAGYVQCVVPAVTGWVDDIDVATSFTIRRQGTLGDSFEHVMVIGPVDTVSPARGVHNYTTTISGYVDAYVVAAGPPVVFDRTLTGVRTTFGESDGSMRFRCDIDWLIRPGFRFYVEGTAYISTYVNFYVFGRDQYMDVGGTVE
jgi:hypothetical protein